MERIERIEASGPSESPRAESLRVLDRGVLVFSSHGRWLHPLFELEGFLTAEGLSGENLAIEDKIIGKAAAFLIVRMGFRRAHGGTMSRLAVPVFVRHGVHFSYERLVDRIDCATEGLLEGVEEVEEGYRIVWQRASGAA